MGALDRVEGVLYSSSNDKTIRSQSASNGQYLTTFSGHTDWVLALALDRIEGVLYSGSDDGTIRSWGIKSECRSQTQTAIDMFILECQKVEKLPFDCEQSAAKWVLNGEGCNHNCKWQTRMLEPSHASGMQGGILWCGLRDTYSPHNRNSQSALQQFAHGKDLALVVPRTKFGAMVDIAAVAQFGACKGLKIWDSVSRLYANMMANRTFKLVRVILNKNHVEDSILWKTELPALGSAMRAEGWDPEIKIMDSKATCVKTEVVVRQRIEGFARKDVRISCRDCKKDESLFACAESA